jgi:peroxiredoxin
MFERLLGVHKAAAPDVGSVAPDFSLATMDGGRFSLSESWQASPVVIAFFKVSCKTCQFTLPFLERLHQAYRNDPAQFWGISQDNAENSRQFARQFGVTFPIAIDGEGYPASKSYVFTHVPTILLIDREGKIRQRFSGFSKAGLIQLSEGIASLISRPPEPVFLPNEAVPDAKPG